MLSMILTALLQTSSAGMSFEEAEALARRDEATLQGELASKFFDIQGKATGRALVACGVRKAREASGLTVVMRLNAEGRVTQTWLNKPSALGRCFEEQLGSSEFPVSGRAEFYTFVGFDF
jgi:hypothetical protein